MATTRMQANAAMKQEQKSFEFCVNMIYQMRSLPEVKSYLSERSITVDYLTKRVEKQLVCKADLFQYCKLHEFIAANGDKYQAIYRKDKDGKRVKEVVDGKKVTVYDEVDKKIKKDLPSRLHARRQMLKVLYPVKEVPTAQAGRKKNTKEVDLVAKLFDEIAPKYENRNGGYTRIVKIGQRKGDAAMEVLIELV